MSGNQKINYKTYKDGIFLTVNATTGIFAKLIVSKLIVKDIVVEELDVTGDVILGTDCTDTLTVNSTATFNCDTTFVKNVTIEGDITVEGEATFQKNVIVQGDITVEGDIILEGDVTLGKTCADIITINGEAVFNCDINANKNIDLVTTTSTSGIINQNGTTLLHTFGTDNIFLGDGAGNFTLTGKQNVGIGELTLDSATTAVDNIAIGYQAFKGITTGARNVGIGSSIGSGLATGTDNIYLSYAFAINPAETGIIRIGTNPTQTLTYISGTQVMAHETVSTISPNVTVTPAQLLGGIVVCANSGTVIFPTGAQLEAAVPSFQVAEFGQVMRCLFVNGDAAANIEFNNGVGVTIAVGPLNFKIVPAESRLIYLRRTAASTFVVY